MQPRSLNSSARSIALLAVRFTITSSAGCSANKGDNTPRAAPPAPINRIRLPFNTTWWLTVRSLTSPIPSVLSPYNLSFSNLMVFTAPARCALSLRSSTNAQASCLNGTVIFNPLPPCALKLPTACLKPPVSTWIAV